jgi:hypothetical protein
LLRFLTSGGHFLIRVRIFCEANEPSSQWIIGIISLGFKGRGHETELLPSPISEVKTAWSYTSAPPYICNNMVLDKAQGCFDSKFVMFVLSVEIIHVFF